MKPVAIICVNTETCIKTIEPLVDINIIPIGTYFFLPKDILNKTEEKGEELEETEWKKFKRSGEEN